MNNSPGWASPGSSPSDQPDRGASEQPTQPAAPEDRPGAPEQAAPPSWSSNQPPPGQWTAPAGIPGQSGRGTGDRTRASSGQPRGGWTTPPGPGGAPGWGGGWAATPPAAKPGVIPLRPLGVGEILDGAVATMRAHWRTVLGISLIVAVISQTAVTLVSGLWFPGPNPRAALDEGSGPPLRQLMSDMSDSLAGSAISSVIGLLATIVATGMLTMIVSRSVLGRSVTTKEAWRDARPQLPRLLGLVLLLSLVVTAVFAAGLAPGLLVSASGPLSVGLLLSLLGLFAAACVSIWLWVRYSLASPALMLEKQGVFASLHRSAKLVRGAWWRVLGIQLLAYLLIVMVEFIVQIPATLIAFLIDGESLMDWANGASGSTGWSFLITMGIGAVISSTVALPISAGVTALLYVDQRIRREALDLELARAAGLPGYGAEAPAAPQATGTAPAPRTAPDAAPGATAVTERTVDAPSDQVATAPTHPTERQPTAAQPANVQLTKTHPSEGENAAPNPTAPAADETPDTPSAPAEPSTDIPGPRPTDAAPGS
ncbi:DUF7544 domain-containing protein [Streptomyces sp. WZ-12]|uniref:DUF7544 domain-containing protein n=1 Tax=Streptomyces sp. WZ-12 TaxID=3030210 RepID=UPI002381691A|nr:hypothetical protein [Streptomyces sp. WZ-12]